MKWSDFKPSILIYKEIIKVGIFMSLISRNSSVYGDAAVSAMGIVLRVVTLGTNVVFGFMKGYQPFVGYNYGAKNYKRTLDITKKAIK